MLSYVLCCEFSLSHFHEANSAAYMANTIVIFISNLLLLQLMLRSSPL